MSGAQSARNGRVVFLVATEVEAAPLLRALRVGGRTETATGKSYLGELGVSAVGAVPAAVAETSVPVALVISGCDKVNAAHALTSLLLTSCPEPSLVVQVGVGGAFTGSSDGPAGGDTGTGIAVGDIVLATQEAYSDTGSSSPEGWLSAAEIGLPLARVEGEETYGVFPLDRGLVEDARAAIVERLGGETGIAVHVGPCVTSSLVTGTREEADRLVRRWGALAESMEGAAAAHVCCLLGVPFLEVRGISNLVGDRNRAEWQVERAASWAARAALAAVAGLWRGRLEEGRRGRDG